MISSLSRIGIYTLFKIRYSYLAMNQSFHNFVFDITIINRFNEEPVISRNPEIIYVMEGILVVMDPPQKRLSGDQFRRKTSIHNKGKRAFCADPHEIHRSSGLSRTQDP